MFADVDTAWIILRAALEERDLLAEFGEEYAKLTIVQQAK